LKRVIQRGSSREGELHDLLVEFSGADDAVMRPDGHPGRIRFLPFPLFLNFRVGIVNQLANMGEGLPSAVEQVLNPLGNAGRGGLGIRLGLGFHAQRLEWKPLMGNDLTTEEFGGRGRDRTGGLLVANSNSDDDTGGHE
jgi:hypothetical protein